LKRILEFWNSGTLSYITMILFLRSETQKSNEILNFYFISFISL